MKYVVTMILMMFALSSCSNANKSASDSAADLAKTIQTEQQPETETDLLMDIQTEPETETLTERQTVSPIESYKILSMEIETQETMDWEDENSVLEFESVDFPFSDMEYMFLVRGKIKDHRNSEFIRYDQALLGGSCDTYESGSDCNLEVEQLYNKLATESGYEQGKSDTRREVAAYSADGKRILLKSNMEAEDEGHVLFELFEGPSYLGSYYGFDIIDKPDIHYTTGLQYAYLTQDHSAEPLEYGQTGSFYQIDTLTAERSIYDEISFDMSVATDSKDKFYCKNDTDEEGNKCIGIYSIADNRLVYQTKEIEDYPITITLLDDGLVAGFAAAYFDPRLYDYYKYELDSEEWSYRLTFYEGSFSPDGKYFACVNRNTFVRSSYNQKEYPPGYWLVCIETGEKIYIRMDLEQSAEKYCSDNYVVCWVNEDEIRGFLKRDHE